MKKKDIKKPTATYQGKEVTIVHVPTGLDYALITKEKDLSQKFKVDISDLEGISKNVLLNFAQELEKGR